MVLLREAQLVVATAFKCSSSLADAVKNVDGALCLLWDFANTNASLDLDEDLVIKPLEVVPVGNACTHEVGAELEHTKSNKRILVLDELLPTVEVSQVQSLVLQQVPSVSARSQSWNEMDCGHSTSNLDFALHVDGISDTNLETGGGFDVSGMVHCPNLDYVLHENGAAYSNVETDGGVLDVSGAVLSSKLDIVLHEDGIANTNLDFGPDTSVLPASVTPIISVEPFADVCTDDFCDASGVLVEDHALVWHELHIISSDTICFTNLEADDKVELAATFPAMMHTEFIWIYEHVWHELHISSSDTICFTNSEADDKDELAAAFPATMHIEFIGNEEGELAATFLATMHTESIENDVDELAALYELVWHELHIPSSDTTCFSNWWRMIRMSLLQPFLLRCILNLLGMRRVSLLLPFLPRCILNPLRMRRMSLLHLVLPRCILN